MPAAPAQVKSDALGGQPAERVIERLDAVIVKRW
jgi:hypothetical protein